MRDHRAQMEANGLASGGLEGVDRRPRRTVPHTVEELCSALPTVRMLAVWTPEVRCNYRQHEAPALAEQLLISVRIVLADLFGHPR
jgi:hypothetical protein